MKEWYQLYDRNEPLLFYGEVFKKDASMVCLINVVIRGTYPNKTLFVGFNECLWVSSDYISDNFDEGDCIRFSAEVGVTKDGIFSLADADLWCFDNLFSLKNIQYVDGIGEYDIPPLMMPFRERIEEMICFNCDAFQNDGCDGLEFEMGETWCDEEEITDYMVCEAEGRFEDLCELWRRTTKKALKEVTRKMPLSELLEYTLSKDLKRIFRIAKEEYIEAEDINFDFFFQAFQGERNLKTPLLIIFSPHNRVNFSTIGERRRETCGAEGVLADIVKFPHRPSQGMLREGGYLLDTEVSNSPQKQE